MADVIGVCAGDDLAPAPVVRKLELGVVAPGVENTPYGDDGTEPPNMPTVGADDPPIPCKVPLADVYGERGRIEIPVPFNPSLDGATIIHYRDGTTPGREISFDPCDQYVIQSESFARAILDDTEVPTPISDAVENMKVIEAILRSGVSGRWETV